MVELSAGMSATPLTQSARNQRDSPDIPLKTFVSGHGVTATAPFGANPAKRSIAAGKKALGRKK